MYFFPVSVLAALTVTPGSGMFPDFTDPVISPNGEDAVGAGAGVGDAGAVGWAVAASDGCATGVGAVLWAAKMLLGSVRNRADVASVRTRHRI